MNSAIERLLGLRVSDVMNRDVITVLSESSMAEAARVLEHHEISGAPVVDETGCVVGVLSVSDFASRACQVTGCDGKQSGSISRPRDTSPPIATDFEDAVDGQVRCHMSRAVQTIPAAASLTNAARIMCREHIHRLIIVDEQRRPVGVISSLDLIAAMVAAIEE